MTENEWRERLANELLSDPRYATGRKRFPRSVGVDDATWIAATLQAETDAGCVKRAQLAARDHVTIACGRGCNGCCEEPVVVHEPEALAVARWLDRPENAAARAAFLAAYPAWREAAGDGVRALPEILADGDQHAYTVAHQHEWRRRVMCAFNRDGDCSIYPVRPIVCRNGHAVDTSERCSGANTGAPATRLAFVPLDQFIARATKMLAAAGHALGRDLAEPLCDAVFRLLSARR